MGFTEAVHDDGVIFRGSPIKRGFASYYDNNRGWVMHYHI